MFVPLPTADPRERARGSEAPQGASPWPRRRVATEIEQENPMRLGVRHGETGLSPAKAGARKPTQAPARKRRSRPLGNRRRDRRPDRVLRAEFALRRQFLKPRSRWGTLEPATQLSKSAIPDMLAVGGGIGRMSAQDASSAHGPRPSWDSAPPDAVLLREGGVERKPGFA
jgi:hypothetical protein